MPKPDGFSFIWLEMRGLRRQNP